MNIELIQAAQQALLALEKSQPDPSNPVIGLTKQDFIDHEETIRQLRAAIQQPATPEPFGYFRAMPFGWEQCAETDEGAKALYEHPAPIALEAPKDNQIAALVNKVRDIARMFHDHQSLRERIAIELVPALKASQEVKSNAERYRWLRDHDHWPAPFSSSQEPEPVRGRDLDSNIDAAMLAAK